MSNGLTPLYAASYDGDHGKVRLLVEELRADVNIADKRDSTPVWIAASKGHLGIVRILLAFEADINRRSGEDMTPPMVAASQKHHNTVTWLVKAGADTRAKSYDYPNDTAASLSQELGASVEQTAYLEAKTHCTSPGCSGAGIMNILVNEDKVVRLCREN
jgi:ankyrin repeat protein